MECYWILIILFIIWLLYYRREHFTLTYLDDLQADSIDDTTKRIAYIPTLEKPITPVSQLNLTPNYSNKKIPDNVYFSDLDRGPMTTVCDTQWNDTMPRFDLSLY
jgi:hypothetical protein